VLQFQRERGKE